jgi:hypothetical protein
MKSCCTIYNTIKREATKAIVLSLGFIVILLIIHHDNKSTVVSAQNLSNINNLFLTNETFIKNNNITDSANISSLISNDFNIEGTINGQISTKLGELAINKKNQATLGADVPLQMYLLDGRWRLDVSMGYVKYFKSNITMITATGKESHEHLIVFKPHIAGIALLANSSATMQNTNITSNNSSISRIGDNNIVFSGVADIITNGVMQWIDVPISVSILNDKVITIELDSNRIDNHFFGVPIYGLISSVEPLTPTQKKIADDLFSPETQ